MADRFSFTPSDDRTNIAEKAVADTKVMAEVVGALGGEERRLRQFAASVVHEISETAPELLKDHAVELADALHRPESQTRWEVLGTLENLVAVDARVVDKALDGAETALHDEESGVVRLSAFRLLSAYGATTARRSERVWPLIAEAVRCYHGDAEFNGMLSALHHMVCESAAADEVKTGAADLMRFDAENAKGALKRRAQRIVDCAPKKAGKK